MSTEQDQDEFEKAFAQSMTDSADSDKTVEAGELLLDVSNGATDTTGGNLADVHGESTANENAEAAQPEQAPAESDPWSSVPEPLRNQHRELNERYQKLEADHRANAGRVAALNRKTEELQQAIAAREKANGGQPDDKSIPSAADLEGKSFAEVEAEWPEIGKFVKQQLDAVRSELTPVLEHVRQQRDEQNEQQRLEKIQNEMIRLAAIHPDYQEIADDPAFQSWVASQPVSVQAMYGSVSADDNASLLTLFKASTGRSTKTEDPNELPESESDLSEYAELPRKSTGAPISIRRENGSFLDEFDYHMKHG